MLTAQDCAQSIASLLQLWCLDTHWRMMGSVMSLHDSGYKDDKHTWRIEQSEPWQQKLSMKPTLTPLFVRQCWPRPGQMTVRWLWAIMPATGVINMDKELSRWRGPALVCAIEQHPMADQKPTGWRMAQL